MPAFMTENSVIPMEMREFKLFRALVHERTGIWLRDGKQIMLASRLSRRLRHHGMTNFADYYLYVEKVQDKGEELRELINCVTTNKTSFFRERHHFDFLAGTVVPELQYAAQRGGARAIRIWSAASSTGQEAYSIAITLLEALYPNVLPTSAVSLRNGAKRTGLAECNFASGSWRIEIVASDIDTKVLTTAQQAIYEAEALAGIAQPLQKKYFLRGKGEMDGQVKVKPEVTRLVQFKRINLMDAQWPIEGLFDVIFFRNALIYFNQETQDRFLRKMARYLKPRGYLFLGNAEHIPWLHEILEPLQKTMYRLRETA
ncbi:MAG: CheR family methyltransferase [Terracidiphilus sp.]